MTNPTTSQSIYDLKAQRLDGSTCQLSEFKDHVLLVVNVASRCGFTSQYRQLQELYDEFAVTDNDGTAKHSLVILGFPCNQFGGQEPGSDQEIQSFCSLNYGVTFPMFSKIEVNGANTHPLFAFLKEHAPGLLGTEAIKWNFTKFLIDRSGKVIDRFAPSTSPSSLRETIQKLL
ncbi:MAG: glutathione peroxidase [Planctomycetes bacterium]|nr:glutathione peroxidase [Planctomycetota bacterium]